MADAATSVTQILNGNAVFANKLYQILARKPGNVFFSPFSVHAVLSMAMQGSQNKTLKILAEVLHVSDPKLAADGYRCLLGELKNFNNALLLLAYKIYVRKGEVFKEDFEKCLKESFHSDVGVVDFEAKKEVVDNVNKWVEEKTQNKIREVIDEESIDKETALLLINAIYFRADWKEQFREAVTCPQVFFLGDGSTKEVQMMRGKKTAYYRCDEDLNADVVGLPYVDNRLKMFIILPKEKNGIKNLEEKLVSRNLMDIIKNLSVVDADLSLPKFKLEADVDLDQALQELGLENIYDSKNANFREMVCLEPDYNLCVDSIIQKSFIKVNEYGAEAAATSIIRMKKVRKCLIQHSEVVTVTVDHPAIFLLTDENESSVNILFMGRSLALVSVLNLNHKYLNKILAMADAATSITQILNGNAVFANKLYQILARNPGNVFFSPFSVHAVLSMAMQGAQKETLEVLTDVLHVSDPKLAADGYRCLLGELKNFNNALLLLAYKIYVRQGEVFKEDFEKCVKESFHSEVEVLDFKAKKEVVDSVNKWVEEKTQSKIKEMITEESIDKETALLLINAIYFNAEWKEQFSEGVTCRQVFFLDDGTAKKVQMMQGKKTGNYKYDEDLNADVVGLPYVDTRLKMFVILPKEKNGIKNLEEKLVSTNLADITKNLRVVDIYLSLPKFKLEADVDLDQALMELGLGNIYNPEKANFREMIYLDLDSNICVDSIIQKTFIKVNEYGAEAAAASVVRMKKIKKKCLIEDSEMVTVTVDHPAIFLLTHENESLVNILFMGRLSFPNF